MSSNTSARADDIAKKCGQDKPNPELKTESHRHEGHEQDKVLAMIPPAES